jgi:hypothetical protein
LTRDISSPGGFVAKIFSACRGVKSAATAQCTLKGILSRLP